TCSSKEGERQNCAANTSAGVVLQRALGPRECLLGKTWGYDNTSVWVSDGCSAEFILGQSPQTNSPATNQAQNEPAQEERIQEWGSVEPGKGFLVGRTHIGELSISAYALTRYINQLPAHQTFTDHLGVQHDVKARDDIYSHRIM